MSEALRERFQEKVIVGLKYSQMEIYQKQVKGNIICKGKKMGEGLSCLGNLKKFNILTKTRKLGRLRAEAGLGDWA